MSTSVLIYRIQQSPHLNAAVSFLSMSLSTATVFRSFGCNNINRITTLISATANAKAGLLQCISCWKWFLKRIFSAGVLTCGCTNLWHAIFVFIPSMVPNESSVLGHSIGLFNVLYTWISSAALSQASCKHPAVQFHAIIFMCCAVLFLNIVLLCFVLQQLKIHIFLAAWDKICIVFD